MYSDVGRPNQTRKCSEKNNHETVDCFQVIDIAWLLCKSCLDLLVRCLVVVWIKDMGLEPLFGFLYKQVL